MIMPLYKAWNVTRALRKTVAAKSYDEFVERGDWFDLIKASVRLVRVLKS